MKLFRKIHLWLSVPFGIIVTLICFSGAMLIFEPEITRSVKSDVYYVKEVKAEPIGMEQLMENVKSTLPDSVSITGVTVFSDKNRTYQVNLSKPRRSSLFIDQYTGEITGKYERLGFFSTMFKLHRWLLDSANPHGEGVKVGKTLVGISTIIFVIVLITGIVIWWPRARKNLGRSLSISFKNGWKGFWKGLHVAGGMYALIFILAMALTGLTYSFGWYRTAFYAVCGVEHTPREFGQSDNKKSKGEGEGRENRGEGRGEWNGERENRGEGRGEWNGERGNRGEGRGEWNGERGNRGEGRGEWNGERGNRGEGHGEWNRHEGADGERGFRGGHRRSEFGRWQQVYDQLRAENPEAPQITVGPETATVTLSNTGNGRASDKYEFSRRSGELTPTQKYSDAKEADKLRGWIYAIHTGSLGGIITRIIWLIAALLGATLPLTGYYIWIRHLVVKKNGKEAANAHQHH